MICFAGCLDTMSCKSNILIMNPSIHEIIYNGRKYPIRDVEIEYEDDTTEYVSIGTKSLHKALCPNGDWFNVSQRAIDIDNTLAGYVDDNDLILMDDQTFSEYCYEMFYA